MHIPDLSSETYNVHPKDGFEYLSVGWLGEKVTHSGDTDPAILFVLEQLARENQLPDSWRGLHDCEICLRGAPPPSFDERFLGVVDEDGRYDPPSQRSLDEMDLERCARDKGEFFVEDGATRYVLPNMINHYITKHRYKLPVVVEAALRRAMGTR